MTDTNEIIRMALEAGFDVDEGLFPFEATEDKYIGTSYNLERFAALVAANVTEALTKSHEKSFQSYVDQAKADRELEALAARLDEREACAKVCEKLQNEAEAVAKCFDATAEECADAIRSMK